MFDITEKQRKQARKSIGKYPKAYNWRNKDSKAFDSLRARGKHV